MALFFAVFMFPKRLWKTPLRGNGEEDDLEDLAWQNSIPNTFGKESDKLGRPLSNAFGPGFLQRVAAGGKDLAGTGAVGKALAEDEEVKSYVRKYAGNSKVGNRSLVLLLSLLICNH